MKRLLLYLSFFLFPVISYSQSSTPGKDKYFLIAHRGGIIDSTRTENSKPALEAAIQKGYYMVEVDLRLTKDSVLIIQHDSYFKRYYGVNRPVSSMTWNDISKLRSSRGNSKVLRFEDVLKLCEGRIQIMIDNKIKGIDTVLFTKIVTLLKNHGLLNQALMIGTRASTPFFTGKIKLSCTREQLEENMKKPGYASSNYYLFDTPENLSVSDVKWAKMNNIQVVAAINSFRYSKSPLSVIKGDIHKMMKEGVIYYQIDSEYDILFH